MKLFLQLVIEAIKCALVSVFSKRKKLEFRKGKVVSAAFVGTG